MLYNPFPEFLWIGPLITPLILRVVLSILLFVHAFRTVAIARTFPQARFPYAVALLFALIGCALLLGVFTQIASLAGMVLTLFMLFFSKRFDGLYRASPLFYALAIAVFASLVLTGAGPLSVDSPL